MKKLLEIGGFLVVLLSLTSISPPRSPVQTYKIVITKSVYELKVYKGSPTPENWIATYPVTFGLKGLADKKREGDKLTPEGTYHIIELKDLSELVRLKKRKKSGDWNKALVLDYPNAEDRKKGKTGGGIWIHGQIPDLKGYDKNGIFVDAKSLYTDGCVAMKNDDINDLVSYLPIGTEVQINP